MNQSNEVEDIQWPTETDESDTEIESVLKGPSKSNPIDYKPYISINQKKVFQKNIFTNQECDSNSRNINSAKLIKEDFNQSNNLSFYQ